MAITASRCGRAWLPAALALFLLLAAGCTCARQADTDGNGAEQPERITSSPPLVNSADDLPDSGDQGAVSSAAGQTEEDAEASDDGEDSGEDAEEGEEGAEDPAEDEGGDDPGDGGDDGNGAEDDPAEPTENGDMNGGEETAEPDPQIDAAEIFRRSHCGDCHGAELKGTTRGPSLLEVDQYWNRGNLADYLKRPVMMAEGNQRLVEMGRQYNLVMPPAHLDDDELLALAAWLIEQAAAE